MQEQAGHLYAFWKAAQLIRQVWLEWDIIGI